MYPYNEYRSSEPHRPKEKLWFRPKSTTQERDQANPTLQYILLSESPFSALWPLQASIREASWVLMMVGEGRLGTWELGWNGHLAWLSSPRRGRHPPQPNTAAVWQNMCDVTRSVLLSTLTLSTPTSPTLRDLDYKPSTLTHVNLTSCSNTWNHWIGYYGKNTPPRKYLQGYFDF